MHELISLFSSFVPTVDPSKRVIREPRYISNIVEGQFCIQEFNIRYIVEYARKSLETLTRIGMKGPILLWYSSSG